LSKDTETLKLLSRELNLNEDEKLDANSPNYAMKKALKHNSQWLLKKQPKNERKKLSNTEEITLIPR
jgi:hypothetical protein